MKNLVDILKESKNTYTWHIFKCNNDFENEEELYNSRYESNKIGNFNTAEEALDDALKFVDFYKKEFKKGKFSVEVFDENDFVMGEEIDNGIISNLNNR